MLVVGEKLGHRLDKYVVGGGGAGSMSLCHHPYLSTCRETTTFAWSLINCTWFIPGAPCWNAILVKGIIGRNTHFPCRRLTWVQRPPSPC
jgi:hypothetical protein